MPPFEYKEIQPQDTEDYWDTFNELTSKKTRDLIDAINQACLKLAKFPEKSKDTVRCLLQAVLKPQLHLIHPLLHHHLQDELQSSLKMDKTEVLTFSGVDTAENSGNM